MKYWLFLDGKVQGPFSLDEIEEMILSGTAISDDLVTKDINNVKWIHLASLPELQKQISNQVVVTGFELNNIAKPPEEFRRTCNVCSKVWHSLVERENQIESKQVADGLTQMSGAMSSCTTCGIIGLGVASQASRNIEAGRSELQRLRSCPECFSSNYREERVGFNLKK